MECQGFQTRSPPTTLEVVRYNVDSGIHQPGSLPIFREVFSMFFSLKKGTGVSLSHRRCLSSAERCSVFGSTVPGSKFSNGGRAGLGLLYGCLVPAVLLGITREISDQGLSLVL